MFIIIGSITADTFVFSPAPAIDGGADGFKASNLVFTPRPPLTLMGGNGGNSAYVLAGLGAPTVLCGAVGQDLLGDTLLGWLSDRGVDIDAVHRSHSYATSSSTIVSSGPESQVVFHHLGATEAVQPEHTQSLLLEQASVLLCSSFPLMSGLRPNGFADALKTASRAGVLTALDIGPAIGKPVSLSELRPSLPCVDYLIANSHELLTLTGDPSYRVAARRLLDLGVGQVVAKLGRDGAYLSRRDGGLAVPAFPVEARISTGAGDAFNVGFLYAVGQGWTAERTLRFGSAVAALVVSSDRGVLGAPTLKETRAFLDAT